MKKILMFCLLILLMQSCTLFRCKVSNVKIEMNKPEIDLLYSDEYYIFDYSLLLSNNQSDSIKIYDTSAFISKIKDFTIEIYDSNANKILTKKFESIDNIGIHSPKTNSEIVFFAKVVFEKNQIPEIEIKKFKINLRTDQFDLVYNCKYSDLINKNNTNLELHPVVTKLDSTMELGIFAIRKKTINEEYIPNSGIIRIEVTNEKGKTVFSSNEGVNFMQVIMPVYPENIGDSYYYSYNWDLKNNSGSKIVPGKYQITMTIPAYPNPYISEFEFNYDGK